MKPYLIDTERLPHVQSMVSNHVVDLHGKRATIPYGLFLGWRVNETMSDRGCLRLTVAGVPVQHIPHMHSFYLISDDLRPRWSKWMPHTAGGHDPQYLWCHDENISKVEQWCVIIPTREEVLLSMFRFQTS